MWLIRLFFCLSNRKISARNIAPKECGNTRRMGFLNVGQSGLCGQSWGCKQCCCFQWTASHGVTCSRDAAAPSSVKDFIKVQSYELCGPEGVWHTGFYLVEPQVQLIWTDEWKCVRCWNRVDSFCSLQPLIGDCNTFHFNFVVHQMENPTWTWKLSVWVSIWHWRRGELDFYTGVITGNCRVQLRPQCQTLLLS